MNNLSVDGEFRYIVSWFNEWSELQREDFVPIMVEYLNQGTQANGAVYMNGMMNAVTRTNISDKPMSLFQCRIKLFREWTPKWPLELKHKLKEKITEIDRKVGERISNELSGENELETEATTTTQQCHANGNVDESAYAIVNGNLNGAAAAASTTTITTTAITTQPIESTNVSTVEVNAVTNQEEESNEIVAVENNENNDVGNGLPSTTNGDSNSANVNGAVNIHVPVNAGIVAVEPAEQVVEMQTVHQQQQQQQQSNNNNNAEVPLVV